MTGEINHSDFRPHFQASPLPPPPLPPLLSPPASLQLSLISEHTQHYWLQAGESGGLTQKDTQTNKHPPPPLHVPCPDPDLRWTSSPSRCYSSPSQWASIRRTTGAASGVDKGLISSERLLCFSNDGLNERPAALPSTHSASRRTTSSHR